MMASFRIFSFSINSPRRLFVRFISSFNSGVLAHRRLQLDRRHLQKRINFAGVVTPARLLELLLPNVQRR